MSFCDSTFVFGQETGYMLLHEIMLITWSLKLKVVYEFGENSIGS